MANAFALDSAALDNAGRIQAHWVSAAIMRHRDHGSRYGGITQRRHGGELVALGLDMR